MFTRMSVARTRLPSMFANTSFNSCETPQKMGTFSQYDHPKTLGRYAEVADALGIKGATDEKKVTNLIKAIDELKAKVGIKPTIKDYIPDEKQFLDTLDEMVEQAFDDQCTGANPRYPLMSEIRQMYLNAYYGDKFTEIEVPQNITEEDEYSKDFRQAYYRSKSGVKDI